MLDTRAASPYILSCVRVKAHASNLSTGYEETRNYVWVGEWVGGGGGGVVCVCVY